MILPTRFWPGASFQQQRLCRTASNLAQEPKMINYVNNVEQHSWSLCSSFCSFLGSFGHHHYHCFFLTASIGSRGPIFFVKSSYHEWKEETSQKSESFDHEHGSRGPSFVFVVDCLLVVGQGLIFFTLQIQERNRKDRNNRRQNTHKFKKKDKQTEKNRNYKPWSFSN